MSEKEQQISYFLIEISASGTKLLALGIMFLYLGAGGEIFQVFATLMVNQRLVILLYYSLNIDHTSVKRLLQDE